MRLGLIEGLLVHADVEAFGPVAFAADQVMVVLIGRGQLKELGAVFQRDALQNAELLEGLQVAVDRDQVGGGQLGPQPDFLRRRRPVKSEERAEQLLALLRHAAAPCTQACEDDFPQRLVFGVFGEHGRKLDRPPGPIKLFGIEWVNVWFLDTL